AGDDQLHLAVHAEVLQRLHGRPDAGKRRLADIFDEHFLGGGGMLLGQKISDRVAEMRTLPKGIDQRSASRHPDWTGPDDL
ncbi:glutamate synthase-related protein, partial [Mesorhizobium sp. M7A.F.Ca.CA.002.12.1.1]|uniref:glutamate synthase-related protein n=1 Tax=Mesorhizobium sp. M7A.F.Ca.CA.002.12.1.1 TaxID=2496735 RepID=UPI001FE19CB4